MIRLSPSSKLVLLVVGVAIVVTGLVGAARPTSSPPPGPSISARATPPTTSEAPTPGVPVASTASPSTAALSAGASPSREPSATAAETTIPPSTPSSPTLLSTSKPTAPPSSPTPTPPLPAGQLSLPEFLARLAVAGEDRTGYDRLLFPHWIDADGDGCDTRREVLIDEAVDPPTVSARCSLSGGRWLSLYDGIETTDPSTFDIDHVVALAEAWDSGASAWSVDRRTRFANDLDVDWSLIAVSASSNRSKSDQDPADWLPPLASARCQYLAMWLAVKVRWSLTIDAGESAALDQDIAGCPQLMPVVPAQ